MVLWFFPMMLRWVITCCITTMLFTLFEVVKMNAHKWIFPLALCFVCVSSNDENQKFCQDLDFCMKQKLSASLGSSVLLPCTLMSNNKNGVSWTHTPEMKLVNISSEGRIKFLDPRRGRVKAFPNQSSKGNFSISIDGLEDSDMGCYRCDQKDTCLQVELVVVTKSNDMRLLIYICSAVAALILLSFCGYLICSHRKQGSRNISTGASIEGASAPPQELNQPPVQEQQGVDNSVYENDNHDPANYQGNPNRNQFGLPGAVPYMHQAQPTQSTTIYPDLKQFNIQSEESQGTKLRFHRELMNRLRQASISRHHYVNQHELRKQVKSAQAENPERGAGKKKAKDNCEYKNPIYNSSRDHLSQL